MADHRARRMPVPDQRRRMAELDAIRLERPLTAAEQAEADRLANRAYHREWRAQQREREAMLADRLARLVPRISEPAPFRNPVQRITDALRRENARQSATREQAA